MRLCFCQPTAERLAIKRRNRAYQEKLKQQIEDSKVMKAQRFTDMSATERTLNKRELAAISRDPQLYAQLMARVKKQQSGGSTPPPGGDEQTLPPNPSRARTPNGSALW